MVRLRDIVISTQHHEAYDQATLYEDIIREVIRPSVPAVYLDEETRYFVNPTGRFVIGGPQGDSGLTGERSSWIRTAEEPDTVVVLFPEKIRRKWIDRLLIWRAKVPRILSQPVWPTGVKFSWPIPSVSLIRFLL